MELVNLILDTLFFVKRILEHSLSAYINWSLVSGSNNTALFLDKNKEINKNVLTKLFFLNFHQILLIQES